MASGAVSRSVVCCIQRVMLDGLLAQKRSISGRTAQQVVHGHATLSQALLAQKRSISGRTAQQVVHGHATLSQALLTQTESTRDIVKTMLTCATDSASSTQRSATDESMLKRYVTQYQLQYDLLRVLGAPKNFDREVMEVCLRTLNVLDRSLPDVFEASV